MRKQDKKIKFAVAQGSTNHWEQVLALAPTKKYKTHDVIVRPGDDVKHLYYMEEGEIRADYTHSDGRAKILHYTAAPSILGEIYFFSGRPSYGSFTCTKPVTLRVFSSALLTQKIFPAHPALLYDLLTSLANKLLLLGSLLTVQTLDSVPARLCHFFYMHTQRNGQGQLVAVLPISKQEIADLLGVHRVTISKTIKDFVDEGLIEEANRREFLIVDEARFFSMVADSASSVWDRVIP